MSSLKNNIAATYACQFYVTLMGILFLPVYLNLMGAEAFGLVAFFTMLQAWFGLLDMGLTPTMARQTARFQGGAIDGGAYRQFVFTLEGIFFFVALFGAAVLFLGSERIASHW